MSAGKYRIVLVFLVVLAWPVAGAWADVTTGLLSHWLLDDRAGATAADAVGGNDGTLQGDSAWAEGYLGGAIEFDGQGDFIDCGADPSLNITDTITLAAWVRADPEFVYPDWSGIIMRGGPNLDTFALYYHRPSQRLGFKTTGTDPEWFAVANDAAEALFDGEWHHTGATYDGAIKTVYLDGVDIGNIASTGKIETSTGRLLLGAGRDLEPPTHYLAGRLDDARIYTRALTAADVKELIPPKLQAYDPDPADGALAVQIALFRWTAGDTATFHDVYLGTDPNLTAADLAASHMPTTLHYHMPGIEAGVQYFWRVDEVEADGTTVHTGNVWSFVAQANTAYHPTPAAGATNVSTAPDLTWLPGTAVVRHHVYFSDGMEAVRDGTAEADKGEVDDPNYAPGELASVATYYWRVDEIQASGEALAGPVWDFTTVLPVDDFEGYTDDEGSEIFSAWIDGWLDQSSGSVVGNLEAPFAEQTVVYSGGQSMPLDYNNVNSPYFSEARRGFSPAQDWTVNGADTLVVYVRGRSQNDAAPLYLSVQALPNAMASIGHPDPDIAVTPTWTEWQIPFSELPGVNMAAVTGITFGLGDKSDPKPGGAGRMYFDDVYVMRGQAAE